MSPPPTGAWIEIQKIILVILQNICYNINEERNSLIGIWSKGQKGKETVGCFYGSIDEFAEKVRTTNRDSEHARDYMLEI